MAMSRSLQHVGKRIQAVLRLIPSLPFIIPLVVLVPLGIGWTWQSIAPVTFIEHRENILFSYLVYIVIVRFALLDLMLFYVSRNRRSLHLDLLQIVFLYLEVTAVTLYYFASIYQMFGVFELFTFTGPNAVQHMGAMAGHDMRVALFVSVELFTTLGLGDWVPQTLNAMLASAIEALLGFVQGGVFFAVLIYAHQNK